MAKYECKICGYVFDEQQAGETFENLYSCPICDADRSGFKLIEEDEVKNEEEDGDDDFVFEEADEDIAEGEASKTEEAPAADSFELNTEEPYEESVSSENDSSESAEENATGSFADFLKEKEKEKESELTSKNEFKDFIDEVLEENAAEEAEKEEAVSEENEGTEEKAEASEGGFVIEKRQEFWKKEDETSNTEEEKKEEPAKTPFTFNRTGSVERVIGGDDYEPSRYSEESSAATEEPERDNGLIQTIYSNANPVKSEEELKAEEEAKNNDNQEFKPLWGNGMGTIQKVIGAESSVVDVMDKTDADSNEEMVFEEEIEENDTDELEKLDGASDALEGTEEDFQTDPVSEEETYEEASNEEETYEEAFTDEETSEDNAEEETSESVEEASEDEAEEINLEEAEEIVLEESASEEENSNEEEAINEEENFFEENESNETSEETAEEEVPAEEIAEESAEENAEETPAEETLFEDTFEENAEEAAEEAAEESLEEPVSEEINEDEGTVIFAAAEETPAEEVFEEASEENSEETAEETSEEIPAEETVEEPAEETIEEAAEEAAEETFAEEIPEEAAEETVEEAQSEEIAEEINEEAAEEIAEETTEEENRGYICLDENEESDGKPVAYSMIKSDTKYTVLYDNEAQKIFDDYRLVDANVSNGLENIILLPAQCNPLPLKKNAFVETKTVIGALTSCPVEVLQPFCFSKLFIWGEHIPNNSMPENYNNQALVLVKGEEGHIPNLTSKEELREEVEIAKARFCGTPVGIDLVAGRIEDDLEACVYAKVDFVILNDVSQRILPYALRRARNYLNRVNSKLEILVCVEALKDAQELAKILALGANFVLVERGFDIEMANNMTEALKEICRSTGHNNVHDLNLNDICTIDTDLAMYTDISHV